MRNLNRVFAALILSLNVFAANAQQDDDRVVPAHEEPRHVPQFENGVVRVIDVAIPEGERTMFHRHSLDYPYVMLSSVTLDNQIHGQEMKPVKIERGLVGYYRIITQGPYTHRFVNRGPGVFRAIGIELLQPLGATSRPVAAPIGDQPGLTTVMDNERIRAWRVSLQPGQSLGPVTLPGPGLSVGMMDGQVMVKSSAGAESERALQVAGFEYRESARTVSWRNAGSAPVEWIEFEFK